MASALTKRYLSRVSGSGNAFSLAKKRADLALKTNVNDKGEPTEDAYKLAAAFLNPFLTSENEKESVDAQRLLAGYDNTLVKLTAKRNLQTKTVSDFKLREHGAYFTREDGDGFSFRNTEQLARNASDNLDALLLDASTAIEKNKADGIDTDALEGYFNGLTDRATKMRLLVNRIDSGEFAKGQFLGEYGVFVKTEPTTGEVYGAAIMPVGQTLDGLEKDYARTPVTTKLESSGAVLPVYGISSQNIRGDKTVNVGKDAWRWNSRDNQYNYSGSQKVRVKFTGPGNYSLSDPARFPVANTSPQKGSLRTGIVGFDDSGSPKFETLYYGLDGKKYSITDEQRNNLLNIDPLLADRIAQGGIVNVDPVEFQKERVGATPHDGFIGVERIQLHNKRLDELMQENGLPNQYSGARTVPKPETPAEPVPVSSFFEAKNRLNVPDRTPTGGTAADIIASAGSFFRKMIG